mmetsp:Transcript_30844/g.43794  ORF Transcript_30844/g.43794 Transcript_30844/m.43794 type:complete len:167 (+) Transcript_30844:90-590(+)|eukprot:CAMPEP_0202458054 /NCGR_PEP_ID=MMETSP1360-20130828/20842_1 /ASSEMBLY_ACC=CAM_ASM_000848 /TAXON_ID=515479 /ORGANISM="Licmophora paradoxa, Strain CCMP2313" /LENGTH=166 /DNA_ID=CAMNT_0049078389 /DNA_START=74 /DNA_END=574 /DNA_ORIENTATION=+
MNCCEESSLVSELTIDSSFPPQMKRSIQRDNFKKAWKNQTTNTARLQLMKRQLEKTQLAAQIVSLKNKIHFVKMLEGLPADPSLVRAQKTLDDDESMIVKPGNPTSSSNNTKADVSTCAYTRETDASQTQMKTIEPQEAIEEEDEDCEDGDLLVGFPSESRRSTFV